MPATVSKITRLPPAVLMALAPVPEPKSTPPVASPIVILPPPVFIEPMPVPIPKLTLPTANAPVASASKILI